MFARREASTHFLSAWRAVLHFLCFLEFGSAIFQISLLFLGASWWVWKALSVGTPRHWECPLVYLLSGSSLHGFKLSQRGWTCQSAQLPSSDLGLYRTSRNGSTSLSSSSAPSTATEASSDPNFCSDLLNFLGTDWVKRVFREDWIGTYSHRFALGI